MCPTPPYFCFRAVLFAQLILMRIAPFQDGIEGENTGEKEPEAGDKPDKNYFGPVYPEAPKFNDPREDLFKIGVTRVSRLKRTREQATRKGWKEIKPGS